MNIVEEIRDIIKTKMNLENNQIYKENQAYNIPKNNNLYITIGTLAQKPYANNTVFEERQDGFYEINYLQLMDTIYLDIYSFDIDIIERRYEVLMALSSMYSQNKQIEKGFKILKLPLNFTNISETEGASKLNKYNLAFNVLFSKKLENKTNYYENYRYSLNSN